MTDHPRQGPGVAVLVRRAVPFDFLPVVWGTEEEGTPRCEEAISAETGEEPRSVFLSTLLEVLAYKKEPWLLDGAALERLHGHLQCAYSLIDSKPHFSYMASWLVRRGCRLYAPAGCQDEAITLLSGVQALIQNRILQSEPRNLLLHEANVKAAAAVCRLAWDRLEVEQPLTREEQRAVLRGEGSGPAVPTQRDALALLEEALRAWRSEAEAQRWPENSAAQVRDAELVLEHLRILLQIATEEARGEQPRFAWRDLESLAVRYEEAGLSSAGVLSTAICHVANCTRRYRPEPFQDATEHLADRLNATMERYPACPQLIDEALRALAQCYVNLGTPERAKPYVAIGVKRLVDVLPAVTDRHTRSYFLRDCEDWVGYAYLASAREPATPGRFFDEMYAALHRRQWCARQAPEGALLIQASVTRPCTVRRASGERRPAEVCAESTQESFITLQRVSEVAGQDLARFDVMKQAPDRERSAQWEALGQRLLGQLRLENLHAENRRPEETCRRVLVETEGNGLHVPWCGLLHESRFQPETALVADLGVAEERMSPPPDKDAGVLVLNCFTADDPLDGYFQGFAAALRARNVRCAEPRVFREELNTRPYRLIIVAAHGWQDRLVGNLQMFIGTHHEDAEGVWKDVRLPRRSVVVAFTCYGGGGVAAATGDFGSLAGLALRAGARAAVTCRWPAWVMPETARHYEALFADLDASALDPEPWRVGRDMMRFLGSMRAQGLWNSLGWGVYVPGRR